MAPWDWFPFQTSNLNLSPQNYLNYKNLWMNSTKEPFTQEKNTTPGLICKSQNT